MSKSSPDMDQIPDQYVNHYSFVLAPSKSWPLPALVNASRYSLQIAHGSVLKYSFLPFHNSYRSGNLIVATLSRSHGHKQPFLYFALHTYEKYPGWKDSCENRKCPYS